MKFIFSLRFRLLLLLILPLAVTTFRNYVLVNEYGTLNQNLLRLVTYHTPITLNLTRIVANTTFISGTYNQLLLDVQLGDVAQPALNRMQTQIRVARDSLNEGMARYRTLLDQREEAMNRRFRTADTDVDTEIEPLYERVDEAEQGYVAALDVLLSTVATAPDEALALRPDLQAAATEMLAASSAALTHHAQRQQELSAAVIPPLQLETAQGIITYLTNILAVIFSILVLLFLFRALSRFVVASGKIAAGDFATRVDIRSQSELGTLARTFNSMAEAIETRDRQLAAQLRETEEARDRAERSDKVKSAFLASMSHELRTPLNAIINFTKFVVKGDMGPVTKEQEEALNESIDSARHLMDLINDVLDMAKIESGSLQLFITDNVDVNTILNQVISTGKILTVGKPVRLVLEVPEPLPLIRADRQRLLQVMLNVMSNACKFTEEGEITVRASTEGEHLTLSISDTGPGIAPEDYTGVFEAFKQTRTGLRQGGGTGLGLPITRSLVEAHGGTIRFESELGKGATFIITLPVRSENLVPIIM